VNAQNLHVHGGLLPVRYKRLTPGDRRSAQ
jgi:hypothetical protein